MSTAAAATASAQTAPREPAKFPYAVTHDNSPPTTGALPADINLWSPIHVLSYIGDNLRLPLIRQRLERTIHTYSFEEVDGALLLRAGITNIFKKFGLPSSDPTFVRAVYRWNADRAKSKEWDILTLLRNPSVLALTSEGEQDRSDQSSEGGAQSTAAPGGGIAENATRTSTDAALPRFVVEAAELRDRVEGSLIALFAGDSLALPVHWYYDPRLLAKEVGLITGYRDVPEHHGGNSIMNKHWEQDKHGIRELQEYIVTPTARRNWERPFRHYHAGLPAGSNTANVQLTRLLMKYLMPTPDTNMDQTVAAEAGSSEGTASVIEVVTGARAHYNATEYLQRYVDFLLAPEDHKDSYIEGFHRQFLVHHIRDPSRPLDQCAGVENHDTASSGGVVQVPVLLAASFVRAILPAQRASDAASQNCLETEATLQVTPRAIQEAAAAASFVIRQHVGLTHDSEQLHRHVKIYSDLLAVTLVVSAAASSSSAGTAANRRRAAMESFRSNVQLVGQHLGWDFAALVDMGISDMQVAYGGVMGPACYIRDSMPLALFLAYKYADDTGAALLANANLGGEACYRGAMLGALLGANNGFADGGLRPKKLVSGLPVDLQNDVQEFSKRVFSGILRTFDAPSPKELHDEHTKAD
eukprot:INCI16181.1.p1 GENE.INCI16181.1~~INCI16181.1.p1  ORF type:complete len:641 (+),score=107.10 INCI16181.1:202-2124(+)